jgi:hypothetical protein
MSRSLRSLVSVLPAGFLLAACAVTGSIATDEPSPSPSAVATPTISPAQSPAPTPVASEAPTTPVDSTGLAPDSYARVVTDNLRVRSKPGVSDDSEKLEPLLPDGVRLLVLEGPISASGYDWYQVKPIFDADTPEGGYPLGWVARAGKDGETWIEPESAGCPLAPTDMAGVSSLWATAPPYAGIACYSGHEVTFTALLGPQGSFSCGVEPPPWGVEPSWLDGCAVGGPFLAAVDNLSLIVGPQWVPEIDRTIVPDNTATPDTWPVVEVTGQFDHPAARTCRNRLDDPNTDVPEPDPALTVLNCRDWFVVTSMREVDD